LRKFFWDFLKKIYRIYFIYPAHRRNKKEKIDEPKHVELKGMDEWTRVRYPPPPPLNIFN